MDKKSPWTWMQDQVDRVVSVGKEAFSKEAALEDARATGRGVKSRIDPEKARRLAKAMRGE